MEDLKKEIARLKLENKRLLDSQAHLGKITNDYLMLYYLTKSVNEAKSTKELWKRYLKNITTDGFKYKNACLLIKEKSAFFDTKLFIKNDEITKKKINDNDFEEFMKQAIDKKETVNSVENTKSAIPIINMHDEITAVLLIESEDGISFEEIQLLEIYAKQTVTTIENIILNEKLVTNQNLLGEKLDQFVMLHYISKDIHDSIKFYEVLEKYLISLKGALGFNFIDAAIYLMEDKIKKVSLENSKLKFEILSNFNSSLFEEAFENKTYSSNDNSTEIVIPLMTSNRDVTALMYVKSEQIVDFEKIQMLDIFAMQTATMLQNTYLNFNLEKEVTLRTKELQEAYSELKMLDKMKDEFLSMVSHELRTPITSIIAFLETILSSIEAGDLDHDTESQFLNTIFEDSQKLKLIVDDIIDLSKLEGDKMIFCLEEISLSKVLEDSIGDFDIEARKKDILIVHNQNTDIPSVNLDKDKIKKVIANILSNAIKFSNKGERIEVSSFLRNEVIGFSIQDYGIGIPEDEQEKVFSKFDQVENISYHSEGTGLGMPISKMLVEKMNGTMYFQSEKDKGTTFYVEFKLK